MEEGTRREIRTPKAKKKEAELAISVTGALEYLAVSEMEEMSEEMLEEAQAEVLVSVYKDECDFVLFDHYRNCKNFDDAVTTFMEVKV